jgi:hypothetical protein
MPAGFRDVHWTFISFFAFPAEEAARNGQEQDYKGDSKFASHLKTSQATSTFAKTRTLKQQREYLPAFACREELVRTLRDNQGPCLGVCVGTRGFTLSQ